MLWEVARTVAVKEAAAVTDEDAPVFALVRNEVLYQYQ